MFILLMRFNKRFLSHLHNLSIIFSFEIHTIAAFPSSIKENAYNEKVKQAILDEQQIETIQHILSQSSKRDNLLFLFTLHSCLKVSEILQLQVRDVLDTNGKIRNSILFYNEKKNT